MNPIDESEESEPTPEELFHTLAVAIAEQEVKSLIEEVVEEHTWNSRRCRLPGADSRYLG